MSGKRYTEEFKIKAVKQVTERIRRRTYLTLEEAKQDVFDYIEMFHNLKRRHSNNDQLSPLNYGKRYFERLARV